jgi:hypothetical protein
MCTADYHVVDHKCEKITSKKTFSMKTIGKDGKTPEVIMIPPARAGVQAKPGHLCLDGEECIGGSKCKEGYCVCSEQQIVIDDKCITTDAEALQVSLWGTRVENFLSSATKTSRFTGGA